ncbi:MAG: hypothetical protein ACI841_004998, partial [Planctomycetota bacterium]
MGAHKLIHTMIPEFAHGCLLHTESFLAELDALGHRGLPRYVQRELRSFLECGILAHGFARVH